MIDSSAPEQSRPPEGSPVQRLTPAMQQYHQSTIRSLVPKADNFPKMQNETYKRSLYRVTPPPIFYTALFYLLLMPVLVSRKKRLMFVSLI